MLYNLKSKLFFMLINVYCFFSTCWDNGLHLLNTTRNLFIEKMFFYTSFIYLKHAKNRHHAWNITQFQLQFFPEDSLGKILSNFLKKNNFSLIPKSENHDVFHLLTNYPPEVKSELGLQFLLLGNGKRSLYLLVAILTAFILTPDYWNYYKKSYKKGKNMRAFYDWDFEHLLNENIHSLKDFIHQKATQPTLNI